MITQVPGKIYLSEQRDCKQSDTFRSYRTFSFEEYRHKDRQPFGSLCAFNENTIAPGHSIELNPGYDAMLILLPLAGIINYQDSNRNETTLTAGKVQMTGISKGQNFTISNPTENTLAGYLQILIAPPADAAMATVPAFFEFDINENKNTLIDLFQNAVPGFIQLSIGKFSARREALYKMKNTGFFAFVIEGEFEVQDRLLHAKDGLALWETDKVEVEALSQDAILLVIDLPLN